MRTSMTSRIYLLLAAIGILASLGGQAHAGVLAYDPIDTSAAGDPSNGLYEDLTPIRTSGGLSNHNIENGNVVGFAASTTSGGHDWVTMNTSLFPATGTAGLTATGAAYASGGAIRYSGYSHANDRGIRRSFLDSVPRRPTAAGESLYFSYLLQAVGTDSGDDFDGQALVGFSDNTTRANGLLFTSHDIYGPIVGFKGDGSNMDLIYRHRTFTPTKMTDLVLVDGVTAGETYQVVAKITADTGAGASDSYSIFINPKTDTEPVAPDFSGTDSSIGLAAFQQMDRLVLSTNDFADPVIFDEFRYGTTWQDVVALPVAVPEPSTFLLGIIGLLGLGAWGRRRK